MKVYFMQQKIPAICMTRIMIFSAFLLIIPTFTQQKNKFEKTHPQFSDQHELAQWLFCHYHGFRR